MTDMPAAATDQQPRSANSRDQRSYRSRLGWRVIRAAGIGYLLLMLLMMWFESLIIYPTWQIPPGDWTPEGIELLDVRFDSQDGTQLNGWYFAHPQPKAYILYCHGNGENLANLGAYMNDLREEFGVSLFAFDYRGYGKSEGKPDESGVLADGCAAQRWLAQHAGIPTHQVVLWGRSIGGAVCAHLAAELGARGVILERTFTSLPDVAARHYPFLPVRTLMRNRYDSRDRLARYRGPLLQSHGTADEIVPFTLGQQLFAAAASTEKQFVAMPGVTHNGPNTENYYTALQRFLDELPEGDDLEPADTH